MSPATTTPNPLPPWLTTRSALSFLPGLYDIDLDLSPPPRRIPVTAPALTTTTTTTTTVSTTAATSASTTEAVVEMTSSSTEVSRNKVEDEAMVSAAEAADTTHYSEDQRTSSVRNSITVPITPADSLVTSTEAGSRVAEAGQQDTDKLVYTRTKGEAAAEDRVHIYLSTLPPSRHYDAGAAAPGALCPPRNIRALSWGWTRPGTTARQSCPPGTVGGASWSCVFEGATPRWSPASPDLSSCRSVWMEKIIRDLRKSEQILNLASDLMQYVAVNTLYGGDVKSAIDAMTIIAEKMEFQLQQIPTREQREAMVMELVQSLTKTASHLLAEANLAAWQDLPRPQLTRFLTNFISALERTGALLPGVVAADQEVSMSSDNLRELQSTMLQITFLARRQISRYQYFTFISP